VGASNARVPMRPEQGQRERQFVRASSECIRIRVCARNLNQVGKWVIDLAPEIVGEKSEMSRLRST